MKKKTEVLKFEISSSLSELRTVEKISNKISKKMKLSEDQRDNLAIALTEIAGNAIVHGNKLDKSKTISIVFKLWDDKLECSVTDSGKGFNLENLDNPLHPENILKESGRGVFIVKQLMDSVSYSFSSEGTTVNFSLIKNKK